jgi:hypothetical protein
MQKTAESDVSIMTTLEQRISYTRAMAGYYHERGFCVLPSSMEEKKPLCKYAQYWEQQAPLSLFDQFPTTNLQIILGVPFGLLVVDLDGEEAQARWNDLCRKHGRPRTWVTHSGGGGKHWWFTVPKDGPAIPKATIWRPGDLSQPRVKGESAIERLCDKSLVVVPPSIHPTTGRAYIFEPGCDPARVSVARAPWWLLRMQPVGSALKMDRRPDPQAGYTPKRLLSGRQFDREAVLASIPDKAGLVQSWGLRFTGRQFGDELQCHAIDREDVNPSASFNIAKGVYHDHGSNVGLSLFDLAAAMHVYPDWKTALQALGGQYAK